MSKWKKEVKKPAEEVDEFDLILNPELPDPRKMEVKEDLTPYKQFQVRPDFEHRFKTTYVKEEISNSLHLLLTGKKYTEAEAGDMARHVADHVRSRIESSGKIYERYKIIVNVILGEFRGAGIKCGARCLWDPECDALVSESFMNESLFCSVTVAGIMHY